MLKKFKKMVSVLLVLMIVSSLVACNSDKKEESTTPETKETAGETTQATKVPEEASTLEHVTLSIYFPGGASGQVDEVMVEEKINEYLADKINASVDLVQLDWASWDQKPNLMISSGEEFDIIFTASWGGTVYGSNVVRGAFLELDELIDQYGQDLKNALPVEVLDGARVDGKIYAIPTYKEVASNFGLLFDKTLLDKYNFDLSTIKKVEDIEPWLKTIKENESDVIPFFSDGTKSPYSATYNYEAVGDGVIPGAFVDGKVVNQYLLPESIAMFDLAYKWMELGYINKDAMQAPQYDNYFCTAEQLKPGKSAELSVGLDKEIVQLDLTKPQIRTGNLQGSMLAISRTSKNPERAMMLLNLMNTDPYLNNLMNFGIEGVHYTKSSDNIISKTDKTDNYSLGANWMFQNQFLNYLWDNEDPQKWEKFKQYNEEAETSILLGFVFDPAPVADEIASVKNAWEQYKRAFNTGSLKFEEYKDDFIKAMDATGLNTVLEEKQKQVDAFLANK
jgi:putative aldouronate transport system substrate-binding protein